MNNMKLQTTIEFKSIEKYYITEVNGRKPNTVRVLNKKEEDSVRSLLGSIEYIKISLTGQESEPESFTRRLIDITYVNDLGVWVFSWAPVLEVD